MQWGRKLFGFVLFAIVAGLQAAYLTELTDDNFYEYVKDKEVVMVEFYAPWCSDCKNIEPEIKKAADTLDRRSGDIAKIDCFGAGRGLCEMYRVKSWPQIKLFNKGNYIGDYQGAQTGDAIALYVESLASNYETKTVPAPMDAFANSNQVPYQPAVAPAAAAPAAAPASPVAAVPEAAPVPAVPASTQQLQQPQKATTQESPAVKVEAHAKAIIHKQKGSKKDSLTEKKLKKVITVAKKIGKNINNKIKQIGKKGKAKAKRVFVAKL